MGIYLLYLWQMTKQGKNDEEESDEKQKSLWLMLIMIVGGAVAITFGSRVTVNAASKIALIFGMSERFIGLTIVAFGTSLPELVTSCTAAIKGKADIAIGNIVGSNIFNRFVCFSQSI